MLHFAAAVAHWHVLETFYSQQIMNADTSKLTAAAIVFF
jgi:hypothetical protein